MPCTDLQSEITANQWTPAPGTPGPLWPTLKFGITMEICLDTSAPLATFCCSLKILLGLYVEAIAFVQVLLVNQIF